ncbi:MAG TPA: NAD(P)-binding oxidoreductase [Anaerolineales bacterium]|nr:NAD(P)-binding oxidoreductase [Anaerolineales bacterium]
MKIFVAGATGATGQLLVAQLLERGNQVVAVVRSVERVPEALRENDNLTLVQASLLDLNDNEMEELVAGCNAAASCLGHNLTLRGIFGRPHRLVTEATRRICLAIKANQPTAPVRYVLMNTTGNRNRDVDEPLTFGEKMVIGIMRSLVPPQADNEDAAEYLRSEIGQTDAMIEWVAVRPDGLIDEDAVTEYSVHPSPIRSPVFDSGQTSRINVGHFMAELITNDADWAKWQGQMPVLYNQTES